MNSSWTSLFLLFNLDFQHKKQYKHHNRFNQYRIYLNCFSHFIAVNPFHLMSLDENIDAICIYMQHAHNLWFVHHNFLDDSLCFWYHMMPSTASTIAQIIPNRIKKKICKKWMEIYMDRINEILNRNSPWHWTFLVWDHPCAHEAVHSFPPAEVCAFDPIVSLAKITRERLLACSRTKKR